MDKFTKFGVKVKNELLFKHKGYVSVSDTQVGVVNEEGKMAVLELTPFDSLPQPSKDEYFTAEYFLTGVKSFKDLATAYCRMTSEFKFETHIPVLHSQISHYGYYFGRNIIGQGYSVFTDEQSVLIAKFLSNLDIYCAVKAMESLLNSKADLALLELSIKENFDVHFDHLAIRCGNKKRGDARKVANVLINTHGYNAPQLPGEAYYEFPDGWSAFPLYKILDNGQVLRLFIDQSDDDEQIIQYWNWVYGFSAHHIALRATRLVNGVRKDIPLEELTEMLNSHGYPTMAPTGMYTDGVLKQLFTKPEREEELNSMVTSHFYSKWPTMLNKVKNGKLLEVVSRTELSPELSKEYFDLYEIVYDPCNPLHSAPLYQYFLPAQAQHVIDTSIIV